MPTVPTDAAQPPARTTRFGGPGADAAGGDALRVSSAAVMAPLAIGRGRVATDAV